MNPQNLIVRYLDQARIMHVATAGADKPWCCSVYFAHDNQHNLYWISEPGTRHSQNIAENERVAGTIVLPQEYGEPVHGLQFEGVARAITAPEDVRQLGQAYTERFGAARLMQGIAAASETDWLYQIKPEQFVLVDAIHFPNEPRQVWHVDEARYNKTTE